MAQRSIARSVAQARYVAMGAARLAAKVTRELDRKTRTMREALGDDPSFVAEIHNIQRYFGALLEAVSDRLVAADRAYEIQKGETRRLRRQRDARARELYEAWVPVRKVLTQQYSRSVLFHLLGYEGKTPREPMPLLCVAREVVARLRDETIELPPARFSFFRIDRHALAAKLEPKVAALDRTMDAVGCAVRDEDVLKLRRDEEWAELRQVKTGVSLFLEGLYSAAELHDLVPGIRNPRGSAARRKAGASKKAKAAAPQETEAAEVETTAPHRKVAGAFLETTALHQVVGRGEDETTLPHQVEARAMHETTATHRVEERVEDRTTLPHRVEERLEDRTTALHRVDGAVEEQSTAAHRVAGAVEGRTTAAHASVGGFDEPETAPHRVARALRLVKTADHGSVGGFVEQEPADHLSDGGFEDSSSAEHGSVGAVGGLPSPGRGLVGGLRAADSAEAGSGREFEELTSPGAGSGDGVEELKPAAAGSDGRFWHAATLRRVAKRLVQGVRG